MSDKENKSRFRAWPSAATTQKSINGCLAGIWLAFAPGGVLTRIKHLIPVRFFISAHANVAGHWSGWQGGRKEVKHEQAEGGTRCRRLTEHAFLYAAFPSRKSRRSRTDVPPHTPAVSGSVRAKARHSGFTGQTAPTPQRWRRFREDPGGASGGRRPAIHASTLRPSRSAPRARCFAPHEEQNEARGPPTLWCARWGSNPRPRYYEGVAEPFRPVPSCPLAESATRPGLQGRQRSANRSIAAAPDRELQVGNPEALPDLRAHGQRAA